MLFKQDQLEGIKAGTVSLAFRKWNKASVKKGSLLKTAIGVVEIKAIAIVNGVTDKEAQQAGYKNAAELMKTFTRYPDGDLYKIKVGYYSEDPRIALREKPSLTAEEFAVLKNKLERLGEWTKEILLLIKTHPRLRAADLAILSGREKDWLKLNVRKLKNLGLTISYHPGYEISPLGKYFLKKEGSL
ncbi:ASCH domain-containing protein [Chitinophaga sp. SYP-B3965]|uniref:ASCH domain-containing protein n=1 Tax=Chitinophaga sp. SYP-B3965 TaxID=2663120 RepID=UPI0012998519|nr:ASCH domain-containing protein [Chitinophaga sp. SYP-B3965]MRG44622.1 ASCH domain-containing protein [Chitinophaga sp. SYP-B3965]